jgi:hypothetical protein
MLSLIGIRQYISNLNITDDNNVYIGKLDNKKQKSIGVYNRKSEGALNVPLGGLKQSSYEVKGISLLVHWNRSVSDSEKVAYQLFNSLIASEGVKIDGKNIYYIRFNTSGPVDVGTDSNGVYEYVIWIDFIYERKS